MYLASGKKIKVTIEDYDHERDIDCRQFLANLSPFETTVLTEIVNNSLEFHLSELCELLDTPLENLSKTIHSLQKIPLFTLKDGKVQVCKEERKYFELQLKRFERPNKNGVDYLHSLLHRIPIHILPSWYMISKSSNDIIESIIEKFLLCPKNYERHLEDLPIEDTQILNIIQDVYKADDFKVSYKDLIKKYSLSTEELQRIALELEYNLVCCTCFEERRGKWEQFMTPFYEWHQYLRHLRDTECPSIEDINKIDCFHQHDFGFVGDISKCVRIINKNGLAIKKIGKKQLLTDKDAAALISLDNQCPHFTSYQSRVIDKILTLKLGTIKNEKLISSSNTDEWLSQSVQEQAMALYFHTIHSYRGHSEQDNTFSDRDIREVEKSLKRVAQKEWVLFEDYVKGITTCIGSAEPIKLSRKGRSWEYSIPQYTDKDIAFVKETIFGHLFDCGMVAIGTYEGKPCFKLTPFGRLSLGD